MQGSVFEITAPTRSGWDEGPDRPGLRLALCSPNPHGLKRPRPAFGGLVRAWLKPSARRAAPMPSTSFGGGPHHLTESAVRLVLSLAYGGHKVEKPIIVLKFGGSVLTSEDAVVQAVAEIYRFVRQGFAVVAVASALKGMTDQLIGLARQYGAVAHDQAARYLLATGEYRSAALLSLAAGRVGLSAVVLQPHEVGLTAMGEPDDAAPSSVNATRIRELLAVNDVVMVPGFVALDGGGQTVLLGRGGTDLSAVFIATRLDGARVRLLKDVDAVFDRDPIRSGGGAKAFSRLAWETAVDVAHPVVQRKAVQLARDHGLEVEVAALGRGYETVIGADTALRREGAAQRPARIAILGCGIVGGGVVERLLGESDSFEIVAILVRDAAKHALHSARTLFTTDPDVLLGSRPDIFLDAGPGVEPSLNLVREFLRRGVPVVSANKQAVVAHRSRGSDDGTEAGLHYSAAVGGGAPFLETVRRLGGQVRSMAGVLNGTTNYVLDRCRAVPSLSEALREAQHAGFAEADSSADLDGRDAAAKIRLLGLEAWGRLPPEPAVREALTPGIVEKGGGGVLKQVARCGLGPAGEPACEVRLERLAPDHFLAGARAEENRLQVELHDGRTIRVMGRGAGRFPTAEAVMADLFETFRGLASASSKIDEDAR